MKNQTRKTTQNDKGNYPSLLDLASARSEFAEVLAVFEQKHPNTIKEKMSDKDPFYFSAKGYFELRNVIAGKASLGPTMRALNAIKALNTPKAVSKRIARQGLSKAVCYSPLALISCLEPAAATNTATIIFSGLLIGIIVTVAAFWWDAYKAGHFNHRRL